MAIMPLLATAVSGIFSWSLWSRYRASGRLQSLAWAISLGMFAAASITLFLADVYLWGPWLYRSFWLLGALLNVPWLAAGSVILAWPKLGKPTIAAMTLLSGYALIATFAADPIKSALTVETGIPRGRDVWPEGSGMMGLLRILSIGGWLVVVGLAAWTSRTKDGMAPPTARVQANTLISVGVTIVAVGGFALGRIGGAEVFSATLVVGVVVMYVGFLFASKAPRFSVADPGDQAT